MSVATSVSGNSIFSSVKNFIGNIFSNDTPNVTPSVNRSSVPVKTPVITSKVTTAKASNVSVNPKVIQQSSTPSTGWSFDKVLGSVNATVDTLSNAVKGYYDAKNAISNANTATKLNEIRNDAVIDQAQALPQGVQVLLPGYNDFVQNPQAANQSLGYALVGGNPMVQSALSSTTILLGLGVLAYAVLKK